MDSYVKGIFTGVAGRGVSVICRFVSVPLAISLLQNERYGLWLAITSFLAWLVLADFGMPSAIQTPLAATFASGDKAKTTAMVCFAIRRLIIRGLLLALASPLLWFIPIGAWFNVPEASQFEFKMALVMSVGIISISLPLRIFPSFSYAIGKHWFPPLAEIIVQLLSLGFLATIFWLKVDSLVLAVVSTLVFQFFCTFFFLKRLLLELNCTLSDLFRSKSPEGYETINRSSFNFLLILLGEGLVLQTDVFLIGALIGPDAVADYAVPMLFFMQFLQIQNVFLRPLWARIGVAVNQRNIQMINNILNRGLLYSLAASLVFSIGVIFFGKWFIERWTLGHISPEQTLLIGIALFTMVASVANTLAIFCNALHLIRLRLWSLFSFGLTKMILGIVLLMHSGIKFMPIFFALAAFVSEVLVLYVGVKKMIRGYNL